MSIQNGVIEKERRIRKAEYFETERTKCVRNKEIRGK